MYCVKKWLLVVTGALLLGGCSYLTGEKGYFRDKSEDYAGEETAAKLSLSETLNPREMPEHFHVPASSKVSGKVGGEVPRPDQRIMRTAKDGYSIQHKGEQRWLLAEDSSRKIWSQLLQFWDVSHIPLALSDEKHGLMETTWFVVDDEKNKSLVRRLLGRAVGTKKENRFRMIVSQGERAGTNEIHIQHISRAMGSEAATVWVDPSVSGMSTLEVSLMNELLVFLVEDSHNETVSLAEQSSRIGEQSTLVYDGNGNPVLKITQPFARSWHAISVGLSEAKIKVTDQNRSTGIFYIELGDQLLDKKGKQGFFSGAFGHAFGEKEKTSKVAHRVIVSSLGNGVQVTIEKDVDTLPQIDVAEQVLRSIQSHLG